MIDLALVDLPVLFYYTHQLDKGNFYSCNIESYF